MEQLLPFCVVWVTTVSPFVRFQFFVTFVFKCADFRILVTVHHNHLIHLFFLIAGACSFARYRQGYPRQKGTKISTLLGYS